MNLIEVKINNADEVIAAIEKADTGISNRTPLMRTIAGTMYSAVMQNFDASGRPAWLGLKYRVGKPLEDTGQLRGSISQHYDNESAVVGTNCIYAAIHNFGGTIKPKKAKNLFIPLIGGGGRKVKSVDIPQREFLKLTPQDEEDIIEDVQAYFQNLIK